jgi:hypothetical protein
MPAAAITLLLLQHILQVAVVISSILRDWCCCCPRKSQPRVAEPVYVHAQASRQLPLILRGLLASQVVRPSRCPTSCPARTLRVAQRSTLVMRPVKPQPHRALTGTSAGAPVTQTSTSTTADHQQMESAAAQGPHPWLLLLLPVLLPPLLVGSLLPARLRRRWALCPCHPALMVVMLMAWEAAGRTCRCSGHRAWHSAAMLCTTHM